MKIFLDFSSISLQDVFAGIEKNNPLTFGCLFSSIFSLCKLRERAIDGIIVDGKQMSLHELKSIVEIPVDKFECVEFFTVNKRELFEKLKCMGPWFIDVAGKLENFSLLLNEGKDASVLSILQDLSTMVQKLFFSHSLFMVLGVPVEYQINGKTLSEYKDEINPLLVSIVDAFERKDMVEASDVAEYELNPLLISLGEGLQRIV